MFLRASQKGDLNFDWVFLILCILFPLFSFSIFVNPYFCDMYLTSDLTSKTLHYYIMENKRENILGHDCRWGRIQPTVLLEGDRLTRYAIPLTYGVCGQRTERTKELKWLWPGKVVLYEPLGTFAVLLTTEWDHVLGVTHLSGSVGKMVRWMRPIRGFAVHGAREIVEDSFLVFRD